MKYVTTAARAREFDKHMIQDIGMPGSMLMENAAIAVTERIAGKTGDVLVLCGVGNNGGDGLAVLRQLIMRGIKAEAAIIGNTDSIKGDAKLNLEIAIKLSLPVYRVNSGIKMKGLLAARKYSVVVDAMFGTGLARSIEGTYADIICAVNEYDAYKIAVDIPSGISADTGKICGCCIRADETVTFQTAKRGHLLYPGREFAGKLTVAPIGIMDKYPAEYFLDYEDVCSMIPKRISNSHKGVYGKLLIIAGCDEYKGACIMSSRAALKSGAGLIKVFCTQSVADILLQSIPEVMSYSNRSWDSIDYNRLDELIAWADTIAVGMGLGDNGNLIRVIDSVLSAHKKTLLDADALNLISKERTLLNKLHPNCILTPHPGEFSRLTNRTIAEIEDDIVKSVQNFSETYTTNVLLKGATTVIAAPNGDICYNLTGNSGLSKGGSGDVLSGLIGSLAAQGMNIFDSACAGAYILGFTAQNTDIPQRAVCATDIIEEFSRIL